MMSFPVDPFMDETCLSDYGETLTMTDFATSATLPDHDPLDFCTNPVELISSFGKRKFEDAEFSNDEESTETSSDYWEWTEEMDSQLLYAAGVYEKDWDKISSYLKTIRPRVAGITPSLCRGRWMRLESEVPVWEDYSVKGDKWTNEEIKTLESLVARCLKGEILVANRTSNKALINWNYVSQKLGKSKKDCKLMWEKKNSSNLKKGSFTAAEDEIIVKRILEWGGKGPGIWVALESELGRKDKRISERWRNVLSKRFPHIRHRCTSKLSLPPEHYQAVSAAAEAFNNGLNHSNSTSNIRTVIENNIVKSPIDGGVAELPSYHPWKKSSNFPSFMLGSKPLSVNFVRDKAGMTKFVWSEEMDKALISAHQVYGNHWTDIAIYLGLNYIERANEKCRKRYSKIAERIKGEDETSGIDKT